MRYRMVLAGILLLSATVVVAAVPEPPSSPQPPATTSDAALQPADGDETKSSASKEAGNTGDKPDEGGAEPGCD